MPACTKLLREAFNIASIKEFDELFLRAETILLPQPHGAKIHRATHWACDEESSYKMNTPCSFLRIAGPPEILMLASGNGKIIGKGGTSATVKLAMDKNGELYAVKIFRPSNGLLRNIEEQAYKEENDLLQDINIAVCPSFFSPLIPRRIKIYSIQHHLGCQLEYFLSEPNLSIRSRLMLAVITSFRLHQLHEGLLSRKGIPYVHFDIKPANITVKRNDDNSWSVFFVDYGSAKKLINISESGSDIPLQMGSLIYLPCDAEAMSNKGELQDKAREYVRAMGMPHSDLIALKRVVYFHPELRRWCPTAASIFRDEDMASLSPEVQSLCSSLIVMSTRSDETALFIASVFANELLPIDEKKSMDELRQKPELQMILVEQAMRRANECVEEKEPSAVFSFRLH